MSLRGGGGSYPDDLFMPTPSLLQVPASTSHPASQEIITHTTKMTQINNLQRLYALLLLPRLILINLHKIKLKINPLPKKSVRLSHFVTFLSNFNVSWYKFGITVTIL